MEEPNQQASQTFMDAVCQGGASSVVCGLCGRLHFTVGSATSLGTAEIEQYRAEANAMPDRYVECADDAIGVGEIDGKVVAWNCPCNRLRLYENFIWSHREMIVSYLRERNAKALAEAKQLSASLT